MDDEDGYFGERVAATYDDPSDDTLEGGRAEYQSIPFRYVWPAELDLMAQLAGMRLRDRWEDWARRPFTGQSRQHVSVWEKP
jgi:hypothetical protein